MKRVVVGIDKAKLSLRIEGFDSKFKIVRTQVLAIRFRADPHIHRGLAEAWGQRQVVNGDDDSRFGRMAAKRKNNQGDGYEKTEHIKSFWVVNVSLARVALPA